MITILTSKTILPCAAVMLNAHALQGQVDSDWLSMLFIIHQAKKSASESDINKICFLTCSHSFRILKIH